MKIKNLTKIFVVQLIILLSIPMIMAQLELPHAFYGTADINGRDLPAESIIIAEINGEEVGRIQTSSIGSYGENPLQRLAVQAGEGTDIIFLVQTKDMTNWIQANQTGSWETGVVEELNLIFDGDEELKPVDDPVTGTTGGSSGGSSGGGSSGGSSTGSTTTSKTKQFSGIQSGKPSVMEIEEEEILLTLIQMYTNVDIESAEITVKKLDEKPNDVPTVTNALGFFEIKVTGIDDSQLDTVFFKFHLPILALQANGYDKDKITLLRFHNGSWQELTTNYVNKDATYFNYASQSEGFSYYAIKGEKAAIAKETETKTDVEQTNEQAENTAQEPELIAEETIQETQVTMDDEDQPNLYIGIIIIMAILIIGLIVFLLIKKKIKA